MADGFPDVLDHLGHVQRDDEPPLETVGGERLRRDDDPAGSHEPFDEPDELREQEHPVPRPVRLHLVVHVACRLEDDLLGAEFAGEALQAYRVDLGDVRLPVDSRREFCKPRRLGRIEVQRLNPVHVKRQSRAGRSDRRARRWARRSRSPPLEPDLVTTDIESPLAVPGSWDPELQ